MINAIELKQLRHFIALAEELHFGRAARRCNISQPPFSVSIRKLEGELGFALFERSSHAVRLTAAGAALYEEAGKVLSQMQHATDVASRVSSGLQGVIRVGFFASMLYRGLDKAIETFEAAFPHVDLQLAELNTSEQIQALHRRDIQYGFVHSEFLGGGLVSCELLREPYLLCLPAKHRYSGRRKLDLADLRDEPFIIFTRKLSPSFYDHVVSLCVAAGFHPKIRYEARNWLTVISCVSKGMGITLVPRSLAQSNLPGLRFVDIGSSPIMSIVSSAWRKSDEGNPILTRWHKIVRNEISIK